MSYIYNHVSIDCMFVWPPQPQIHMLKRNFQYDDVWSWGLWELRSSG